MIYGWFMNLNCEIGGRNYAKFTASRRTRWLLGREIHEKFMCEYRLLRRLTLPCVVGFYLLALWGVLSTP